MKCPMILIPEEYDFSGQKIVNKGHDHSSEIDANL